MTPSDLADPTTATLAVVTALDRAGLRGAVYGGLTITRLALFGSDATEGFNVVDLVEPRSPRYANLLLERALRGELREQPVTIVSPEDFVLLKVLSTRDRDVEDAASVWRTLGPELDRELVEREAAELGRELTDHPVADRLMAVLAHATQVLP